MRKRKQRKRNQENERKIEPRRWRSSTNSKTRLDPTLSFQNELVAEAEEER